MVLNLYFMVEEVEILISKIKFIVFLSFRFLVIDVLEF